MMKGLEKEKRSEGQESPGCEEKAEGTLFNVLEIYRSLYGER